jgi:hypothetical protein
MRRGGVVEPVPEPVEAGAQRFGRRPPGTAVGEPGVARAVGDRGADGGVGEAVGQALGEADDVAFVRAAAVQEQDQWRGAVFDAVPGNNGSDGFSSERLLEQSDS